jgi:NADH-quinone oxidoreductase subunit L
MQTLIILIPILPLAAFLLNGLFGRFLRRAGGWLAVACMAGSAAIGGYVFWASLLGRLKLPIQVDLWQWMAMGGLNVQLGFRVDQLTALMLFFVTFVSTLVFLYSLGYMAGDPGFNRFFAYMGLFDFSMLVLVLGDSLPVLFIGWEGVGLCSYLLIGFWFDLKGAPEAGVKAFVVNRIGDFGFLIAMFMLYRVFGTLNMQAIVQGAADAVAHPTAHAAGAYYLAMPYFGATFVTWVTLAMFLGCTGKSAQIPLFVWLPDAMAGPTPVSALIHAATMVTAGVYLMVRMSALFAMAPITMAVVAIVAAATAFVAGSIALTQRDIKKVLAYSTVSQLGFMFLACGVGAFTAGIFHVFTHAFFKGCLFLGAGSVIVGCHHEQDLHKMGGLKKWMPTTRWTYLVACLGLAGCPLLAGFFSKDEILWQTFAGGHKLLWVVGIVTALMTAFYAFRSYFMTFEGECRLSEHAKHRVKESPWTMTLPLILLAIGTLGAGYMNLAPVFTGHEGVVSTFLEPVVAPAHAIIAARAVAAGHAAEAATAETAGAGHGMEWALMGLSVALVALGIFLAYLLALKLYPDTTWRLSIKPGLRELYQFSLGRWFWDDFYNVVFAGGLVVVAAISVAFDRYVIDGILHGIAGVARTGSDALRLLQNGQVQAYALAILLGANILLLIVWFS